MAVTLAVLRTEFPHWEWRAQKLGLGWVYVGNLAFAEVRVQAFSVLCGPSDDDFETQWRVTEGQHSEPYASFWARHSSGGPCGVIR